MHATLRQALQSSVLAFLDLRFLTISSAQMKVCTILIRLLLHFLSCSVFDSEHGFLAECHRLHRCCCCVVAMLPHFVDSSVVNLQEWEQEHASFKQ